MVNEKKIQLLKSLFNVYLRTFPIFIQQTKKNINKQTSLKIKTLRSWKNNLLSLEHFNFIRGSVKATDLSPVLSRSTLSLSKQWVHICTTPVFYFDSIEMQLLMKLTKWKKNRKPCCVYFSRRQIHLSYNFIYRNFWNRRLASI